MILNLQSTPYDMYIYIYTEFKSRIGVFYLQTSFLFYITYYTFSLTFSFKPRKKRKEKKTRWRAIGEDLSGRSLNYVLLSTLKFWSSVLYILSSRVIIIWKPRKKRKERKKRKKRKEKRKITDAIQLLTKKRKKDRLIILKKGKRWHGEGSKWVHTYIGRGSLRSWDGKEIIGVIFFFSYFCHVLCHLCDVSEDWGVFMDGPRVLKRLH